MMTQEGWGEHEGVSLMGVPRGKAGQGRLVQHFTKCKNPEPDIPDRSHPGAVSMCTSLHATLSGPRLSLGRRVLRNLA